jgi:hypothetical protein
MFNKAVRRIGGSLRGLEEDEAEKEAAAARYESGELGLAQSPPSRSLSGGRDSMT